MEYDDTRPFPIQREYLITGKWGKAKECTIPWWLAQEAYIHYEALFGGYQSLMDIAVRGGFGRQELLALLRREKL